MDLSARIWSVALNAGVKMPRSKTYKIAVKLALIRISVVKLLGLRVIQGALTSFQGEQ